MVRSLQDHLPILEEIAEEQGVKLRVGKVNVDEELELGRRFDVMSIPTLILFKDGEPQLRIVGAKGKGHLLQELHRFL
jgi:thioredoxin 1